MYPLEAFFDALSVANYYGDLEEWLDVRRAYITMFERLSAGSDISGTIGWDAIEVSMLEESNIHRFIASTTAGKRFMMTGRGDLASHLPLSKKEMHVQLFLMLLSLLTSGKRHW